MSFSELYRLQRNTNQRKQERIVILKTGVPKLSELIEGVLEIRKTRSGLVQYTKYNNQIYKVNLRLDKSVSVTDKADELDDLLESIPVAAEANAPAATAVVGDTDNTELLVDVEAIRVKINNLLTKLRTANLVTS